MFFHRRDIHPHGRRDPLVVSELVPDERLNLLRSFRTQSFPELAQRGTLYKMGLFRKNASENHPHHVLVEPLHNLLIRPVEPVRKSHEADQQPGRFGRTAGTGAGIVRSLGPNRSLSSRSCRKAPAGGARGQDAVVPPRKKGSVEVSVPASSIGLRKKS